jgi:alkylation response protein AidB-like acyl-CoA dehydrogenase
MESEAPFRESIRTWIRANMPVGWRELLDDAPEDEVMAFVQGWMRTLAAQGFAAPALSKRYGGAELTFDQQLILMEELARADAPPVEMFMVTQVHAPATMLEWGSPEQQEKYLPTVGRGEIWCQGFSEPGSGSDLASLRTRAVQDGESFVVNGQKIWSSFSRHASYCLLLARTDPDAPKRQGISYFALDMQTPGVEVRPIRQATGNAEFSEIFLTDVRVPASDLLGPLNGGWAVAQSTLAAERGILAFERMERLWWNFGRFLQHSTEAGAAWLQDPQRLSELTSLVGALRAERRLIRDFIAGGRPPLSEASYPSIIKISNTEIAQAIGDFEVRVGGLGAQVFRRAFEHDFNNPMYDYLSSFGNTISAGANEVMRNLIAERTLGMPR